MNVDDVAWIGHAAAPGLFPTLEEAAISTVFAGLELMNLLGVDLLSIVDVVVQFRQRIVLLR